jgi:hypothetical protein
VYGGSSPYKIQFFTANLPPGRPPRIANSALEKLRDILNHQDRPCNGLGISSSDLEITINRVPRLGMKTMKSVTSRRLVTAGAMGSPHSPSAPYHNIVETSKSRLSNCLSNKYSFSLHPRLPRICPARGPFCHREDLRELQILHWRSSATS